MFIRCWLQCNILHNLFVVCCKVLGVVNSKVTSNVYWPRIHVVEYFAIIVTVITKISLNFFHCPRIHHTHTHTQRFFRYKSSNLFWKFYVTNVTVIFSGVVFRASHQGCIFFFINVGATSELWEPEG